MYLKNIEINGFKSFAAKTSMSFGDGITCIVGPNGSGKSNIADAVRWVLGEQRTKQLRGGVMQDVIFAGTQQRKPQGFAFVSITLDNSDHALAVDFDEVTVSRRLFRSGESEYLINGSPCRLKDINELFYDTGIGKEGYSIIGQGQIDKILSSRPEDRRELFDEAAGIVKFKRRKAAAQKKLEAEHQNELRVADITDELGKRIGPLKKQSEAARKYLNLREEKKRLDANVFLSDMEQAQIRQKENTDRTDIVNGDIADTRQRSENAKAKYEEYSRKEADADRNIESLLKDLSSTEIRKENLSSQIAILNEQIRLEMVRADHAKETRENLLRQKEKNTQDAALVREKLAALEKEEKEAAAKKERLAAEAEAAGKNIQGLIALTTREEGLSATEKQLNIRREELLKTIAEQKDLKKSLEHQREEKSSRAEAFSSRKEKLQEEKKAAEKKLDAARARLSEGEGRQRQLAGECAQAEARLMAMQGFAERYEGFGYAIRRVMEAKNRYPGIRGVVSELFSTQKKYETAIETALGGALQNVVTDTEETAKELITFLKNGRFGRVTFLPLSAVRPSQEKNDLRNALNEPGVLGTAYSLISTKAEYGPLLERLLGRILVTDDIDHAIAVSRKYDRSFRIVTLSGELFGIGGSMTGGTYKTNANLVGRGRELSELTARVEALKKDAEACKSDLKALESEFGTAEAENAQVSAAFSELLMLEKESFLELTGIENQLLENSDRILSAEKDLDVLEKEIKDNENEKLSLSHQGRELTEKDSEKRNGTKNVPELLENERLLFARLNEELLEAGRVLESLRQQAGFKREELERLCLAAENAEKQADDSFSGQQDIDAGVLSRQNQITAIEKEVELAGADISKITEALNASRLVKDESSGKKSSIFAESEEINARLAELSRELFRLQSQREKLDESIESSINFMWDEYSLTLETAGTLKDPALSDAKETKAKSAALKKEITGLGNINLDAIEEYQEVSSRYEFLCSQYEDLKGSEEVLLRLISELDEGMLRQFDEHFARIKKEFARVFAQLFGGGSATLELISGDDMLESGIAINAQPPGKKLQNMMQLSGGEKALTAIALLFAIQNLSPSPFCLLDEIEAALDDANVDRFARYLHNLTEHTQFIIITHRRGTMLEADRLYGITMQEKGVSAMVSVNLVEDSVN